MWWTEWPVKIYIPYSNIVSYESSLVKHSNCEVSKYTARGRKTSVYSFEWNIIELCCNFYRGFRTDSSENQLSSERKAKTSFLYQQKQECFQ